jgi:hypothetical protein
MARTCGNLFGRHPRFRVCHANVTYCVKRDAPDPDALAGPGNSSGQANPEAAKPADRGGSCAEEGQQIGQVRDAGQAVIGKVTFALGAKASSVRCLCVLNGQNVTDNASSFPLDRTQEKQAIMSDEPCCDPTLPSISSPRSSTIIPIARSTTCCPGPIPPPRHSKTWPEPRVTTHRPTLLQQKHTPCDAGLGNVVLYSALVRHM